MGVGIEGQEREIRLTVIDRLVNAVSPMAGTKRLLQRAQQSQMGDMLASFGYVGGRYDRVATQEWTPSLGSANADHLEQAETLRARSRDLARNAPIATGASNTATTNIIGTGLRLHSTIDRDTLGLTSDAADVKQRELEVLWRSVCNRLDFEGDVSQQGLQAMIYRGMFESGDILMVRRKRKDPGDTIGLKVQLVEADRVENPQRNMDTDKISGGVEVDGEGRPVAYHVANRHPGDTLLEEVTSWARVPKVGRGGLPLSRLIFDKRRPGQRRGVPILAPVIEPLKQVSRLTDYELAAAVTNSMFTVFVTSEKTDEAGGLPVSPEGTTAPTKAGQVFGQPNMMIDLEPGEQVQTASPTRPNDAFAPFFNALVTQIGMAIEVPRAVLMHVYEDSFSASRAAILDAWRMFHSVRQFLGDQVLDVVYEWVVTDAVSAGLISLPGFVSNPVTRQAWLGAKWIGDAQAEIDQDKAVSAAIARIDAGLSNRTIEAAGLMGRDWGTDIQPQRELEKARLDEAEMDFAAKPAPAAPAPAEGDGEGGGEGSGEGGGEGGGEGSASNEGGKGEEAA